MFDSNRLRAHVDPNDTTYVMACTRYLFGPLDAWARKALDQANRGRITYRFAMIALARLSRQLNQARRHRLGLD